jgi:hypothetical protein
MILKPPFRELGETDEQENLKKFRTQQRSPYRKMTRVLSIKNKLHKETIKKTPSNIKAYDRTMFENL